MARTEIDPGMITAAQEGCRVAFDGLVKATYDDTYSLALRLTGNPADAEDVAQDTYLRVFKHLRRFRGDAHLGTWLHRITVNCASNLTAKRGRVRRHEEYAADIGATTPTSDPSCDPAERATADDLRTRLQAAVESLPHKLRDVVVLRDVAGLSHDAIARQLGISESAAKVRLHRARQRLRAQLFGDATDSTAAIGAPDPTGSNAAGAADAAHSTARRETPDPAPHGTPHGPRARGRARRAGSGSLIDSPREPAAGDPGPPSAVTVPIPARAVAR